MSTYNSPTDIIPRSLAKSASLNAVDAATATAFSLLPDETLLVQGKFNFGVDTGAVNAYEVAMPTTVIAYADALEVRMRALNTNTSTTATLNVDSVGAVAIRRPDDSVLAIGDITVGVTNVFIYSSVTTHFHLFPNSSIDAGNAATEAAAAAVSAAAALVSENNSSSSATAAGIAQTAAELAETNAAASEAATAADLILTNADVVSTNADVVTTNADVVLTNADVVLTNADAATTAQDVIDTTAAKDAAETAQTGAETAETNAETAETAAELAQTGAETAETNAAASAASIAGVNSNITSMTGLDDDGIPLAKVDGAIGSLVEDTTPQLGGTLGCSDELILGAKLADTSYLVAQYGTISSNTTFGYNSGEVITCTIGANLEIDFNNVPVTGSLGIVILEITNGGAYTITWPGSLVWDGGVAPILQASGVDIITLLTRNAGTTWRGIRGWKEA